MGDCPGGKAAGERAPVRRRLLHGIGRRWPRATAAPAGRLRRSRSLAFYLACYLAAAVIPLLAVIVLITSQYVSSKRVQIESYAKSALDDIRDELNFDMAAKIASMEALATSPALKSHDLAAFHAQARSLLRPEDVAIILRDENRRQIMHTRLDADETPPFSQDATPIGDVFTSEQPFVSDLYLAEHTHQPRVSITVPVVMDGRVAYALSVSYAPSHFDELFKRQSLAASYYASVTDRTGKIIARSKNSAAYVGRMLPGFAKAVGASGRWSGVNPQGIRVMGFYRRSHLSGWLFSIGVDEAVVAEPLYNSLITLAALCGVLIAAGFGLTFALQKNLVSAFGQLASLANNLNSEAVPITTPISEINLVGGVLASALTRLHAQAQQLETAKDELESRVAERTVQLSKSAVELAVSNERFEAAIDHMSQGLCMLDSDQTVVVCNGRFREI
jgi:PAS domain-containing protein